MPTAVNSEAEQPLWLALLFSMGGEVLITVPPAEDLPVYGREEAGILALQMTEAIEDGSDCTPIKALCGIYFRTPVSSGDLSCYQFRHQGVSAHPEAVGFFIPPSSGWNMGAPKIEA